MRILPKQILITLLHVSKNTQAIKALSLKGPGFQIAQSIFLNNGRQMLAIK